MTLKRIGDFFKFESHLGTSTKPRRFPEYDPANAKKCMDLIRAANNATTENDMKVKCIRIEIDSLTGNTIYAFIMVADPSGQYQMPGELRVTNAKAGAYTIGTVYQCTLA